MDTNKVRTFCRVCEPACGLVASVEEGRLVQLRPDRDHSITQGYACHKGLAGFDIHHDPDRLNHPLRRAGGGTFASTSWDDALREIGGRLAAIVEVASPIGDPHSIGDSASLTRSVEPGNGINRGV